MEQGKMIVEAELYLIRHGQTYGNVGYDKQDLTDEERFDPVLTPHGEEQVKLAADALSKVDFDCIYSSALRRAVMTASEINKQQTEKKPLLVHPLLTEVDVPKEYKGFLCDDLKEIYGFDVMPAEGFEKNDTLLVNTPFEDAKAGLSQAKGMFDYLVNKYKCGEKIAIVAHAGLLTNFMLAAMGFTEDTPNFDIRLTNAGITKILIYKHGTNIFGDIIFHTVNDVGHLNIDINDR